MSGYRAVGIAGVGLVLVVVGLAFVAGAGVVALLGGGDSAPSSTATADVPAAMLSLYEQAATTCPGLSWTVLAAIGTVESDNGRSTLPGVHSGANYAGAEVFYRSGLGCRHVRDGRWLSRACGVSARCKARTVSVPAP
jgi:hypothetical protein